MRFAIILTLCLAGTASAGAIHKWGDEEGNVHYGDAPPVTAKTESVRVQSAPTNPGRALPRLNDAGDEQQPGSAGAPADDEAVPADQAKVACDQAREDLEIIGRSSRIKLRAADGSERYLSTEEIAERTERAETDVKRFCK